MSLRKVAPIPPGLRTWGSVGILCVVWVVACWPWLGGRAMIGWDNIDYVYPQMRFFAQSMSRGELPWWNPYSFGGTTVIGDPQGMFFVPHTLAAALLGDAYSIVANDIMTLAGVLLGAIALFFYALGETRGPRLWPLVGAVVFMLGGSATGRLEHVPQIVSYSMLPIVLLVVQSICLRPRVWKGLALALAVAALLLNLNQVAFLAVFLLTPLALVHLARSGCKAHAFSVLLAGGLAGAAIAGPVIAAMLETLQFSTRSSLLAAPSPVFPMSLPPFMVAGLVLDGLFGFKAWPQSPFWGPTDPSQDYLYIGVLPALVIVISLAVNRLRPVHFAACLLLFLTALLFSMGSYTPFFLFLFDHVPGFAFTRRPADGEYFLGLFAALLVAHAGTGLSAGIAVRHRLAQAVLVLGIVLLAAVAAGSGLAAFARQAGQAAALQAAWHAALPKAALALAVLALALWPRGRLPRNLGVAAVVVFVAADLMAGHLSPFVAVPDARVEQAPLYRHPATWRDLDHPMAAALRFLEAQGAMGPGARYRVEVLGGPLATATPLAFEAFNAQGYSPLRLFPYAGIFGAQGHTAGGSAFPEAAPDFASAPYRALGLRWVLVHLPAVVPGPPSPPGWKSVGELRAQMAAASWARKAQQFGDYEVWELPHAEPRLRLVQPSGAGPAAGRCTFRDDRPTRLRIACETNAPAELVLNDAMAPGWTACVGNSVVPIELADGVFRRVAVPAGRSVVVMTYQGLPWLRTAGSCPE